MALSDVKIITLHHKVRGCYQTQKHHQLSWIKWLNLRLDNRTTRVVDFYWRQPPDLRAQGDWRALLQRQVLCTWHCSTLISTFSWRHKLTHVTAEIIWRHAVQWVNTWCASGDREYFILLLPLRNNDMFNDRYASNKQKTNILYFFFLFFF